MIDIAEVHIVGYNKHHLTSGNKVVGRLSCVCSGMEGCL